MAIDGKWNESLYPDMPIDEAARETLTSRFKLIIERWKKADADPNHPDAIHDLRVASRRATAALDMYHDILSGRQSRRLRRQLRKIRDAAGRLRDRDIFVQQIGEWRKCRDLHDHPGVDYLLGIWKHERARATRRARRRLRRHDRFVKQCESIRWRHKNGETLHDRAMTMVPWLLDEFAHALASRTDGPDDLHAIRLAGKELRYGLELFSKCISPALFERPYELLEELQDLLGSAHDAEVNARLVRRELKDLTRYGFVRSSRYIKGIENWLTHLQSIESAGPGQFVQWLQRWEVVSTQLQFPDAASPTILPI